MCFDVKVVGKTEYDNVGGDATLKLFTYVLPITPPLLLSVNERFKALPPVPKLPIAPVPIFEVDVKFDVFIFVIGMPPKAVNGPV